MAGKLKSIWAWIDRNWLRIWGVFACLCWGIPAAYVAYADYFYDEVKPYPLLHWQNMIVFSAVMLGLAALVAFGRRKRIRCVAL